MKDLIRPLQALISKNFVYWKSGIVAEDATALRVAEEIAKRLFDEEKIANIIRDNLQFKDLSIHNGRILLAQALIDDLIKRLGE